MEKQLASVISVQRCLKWRTNPQPTGCMQCCLLCGSLVPFLLTEKWDWLSSSGKGNEAYRTATVTMDLHYVVQLAKHSSAAETNSFSSAKVSVLRSLGPHAISQQLTGSSLFLSLRNADLNLGRGYLLPMLISRRHLALCCCLRLS